MPSVAAAAVQHSRAHVKPSDLAATVTCLRGWCMKEWTLGRLDAAYGTSTRAHLDTNLFSCKQCDILLETHS